MKNLADLTEKEVLALAIASEQEDSQIYQVFAEQLRTDFPGSAEIFDDMAEEERGHRSMLFGLYRDKFGEHMPPIRREDVRGFDKRDRLWMKGTMGIDKMRRQAERMELQAASFYEKAAAQSNDVSVREMLVKLAEIERGHEKKAGDLVASATQKHGEAGTRYRAAAIRAAICAAWPCRPRRWIGLDARARLRGRIRHA